MYNMIKNLNWQEADQLAIYKHDQGVEPVGSTEKQLQVSGQNWTWPRDFWRPNQSATLPPYFICILRKI